MLAALLFLASLEVAQGPAKQAENAPVATLRGDAVLGRDPSKLAHAEPSRWLAWRPNDAVPEALKGMLGAGMRAYAEADYTQALTSLFAVLDKEPDFPPALYQAATTYFRLRRYGDCITLLERFIVAAPSQLGATQALGHCYYTLGDYAKARAHYELVLAAAPQSVEAWRGLGLTHMRLGENERALECLKKALELRPDHAEALSSYAQILFEQGRDDEALAAAQKARDIAPHEPRNWFVLGQILGDLGRDDEAHAARDRFAELSRIEQEIRSQEGLLLHDAHAVEPLRKLVVLQRAAGNVGEVRQVIGRLLKLTPSDVKSYLLALDTFHAIADVAAAKSTAADIEQRFADNADAWKALADFYSATGDLERSKHAAEKSRGLRAPGK